MEPEGILDDDSNAGAGATASDFSVAMENQDSVHFPNSVFFREIECETTGDVGNKGVQCRVQTPIAWPIDSILAPDDRGKLLELAFIIYTRLASIAVRIIYRKTVVDESRYPGTILSNV